MIPRITARMLYEHGRTEFTVIGGSKRSRMLIAHAIVAPFLERDVSCDWVSTYGDSVVVTVHNEDLPSRLSDVRQARLEAGGA